jgi:hypothetical protein
MEKIALVLHLACGRGIAKPVLLFITIVMRKPTAKRLMMKMRSLPHGHISKKPFYG